LKRLTQKIVRPLHQVQKSNKKTRVPVFVVTPLVGLKLATDADISRKLSCMICTSNDPLNIPNGITKKKS
ncbi:hypothetical protein KAU55_04420, partial [Candidatus Bathyarchaeota archaeon]|nr:hypothetical protein [Candidatus Bathyarchaeota archaeon]